MCKVIAIANQIGGVAYDYNYSKFSSRSGMC